MNPADYHPRFQLALRRSLFFLFFLSIWFLVGTVVFAFFTSQSQKLPKISTAEEIFENRRTALLNVLWAESVTQSESDWYSQANKKMELYEKILSSTLKYRESSNSNVLTKGMKKAFYLISLVGLGEVDEFSTEEKIFAVFYVLIGAPIFLIVLTQFNKMISTLWKGSSVYWPFIGFLFFSSVAFNVLHDDDDPDESFVDVIFRVFLLFTSIGNRYCSYDSIMAYLFIIIGLSFSGTIFAHVQHEIERNVHSIELNFNKTFSVYERWMSEKEETTNGYKTIIEEDEDEDYEESI
ncbi:unnamed protein product [Auanema sp. JU1783]|nr:unnamed protein product [Auanema sp. JU1783]